MATEELLDFSVASMVENVLHQHGKRLNDIDLASRKAEEACMIIFKIHVFIVFCTLFLFINLRLFVFILSMF